MFDQLSDRLQSTLSDVRSRGKLSEDDVDKAMREIRLALLEADVNFKVVKSFTKQVKERCLGAGVLDSLDPGQQVVKIVSEELAALMGGSSRDLALAPTGHDSDPDGGPPGLGQDHRVREAREAPRQGGQEGWAGRLRYATPRGGRAAGHDGRTCGGDGLPARDRPRPVDIAEWAVGQAKADSKDVLIIDTAGRLHVDQELMGQLAKIKKRSKPHDVLLAVDAMTGQDAVNVAERFAEEADFDGVLMTKLDGDARGGAALSVKAVTGKPILFASTGERIEQLERFHPERMASRILGMGDVLSLIEKAEEVSDADQAKELERKIRRQEFTLEDFLDQMRQVRKMGPLSNILGMMPGHGQGDEGDPLAEHGRGRARPPGGDHPLDDPRPSGPAPT